jgi:hypothetical protein
MTYRDMSFSNSSGFMLAGAVCFLARLRNIGITVEWNNGRIRARASSEPDPRIASEIKKNVNALGVLLRPGDDGWSELDRRREAARPLLENVEARRPSDVSDDRWRAAMNGLEAFLVAGHADEAQRLGWSHDELFAVPPVWARVDLCGVGLLIGDREVTEVTAGAIQIKAASGATLSFYRPSQPDFGLVYRERLKLLRRNVPEEEARARAYDFTVSVCREHSGCDLEKAKSLVRAAIAKAAVQ